MDPMTDLLTAFGIDPASVKPDDQTPPGDGDTPPGGTPPQDDVPPGGTAPDDEGDGTSPDDETDDGTQTPPETKPQNDRQAQAFANMRVQNRQLNDVLKGVAQILKVPDGTAPDQIMQAVQDAVIKAQSKQSGIPENFLREQQETKIRLDALEKEKVQGQAYLGFQNLKNTFGLEQADLEAFADELIQEGNNPFEQSIDIVGEYQRRHFQDILKKEVDKAVQAEQARAANADEHGSKPNQQQGQAKPETGKISTVADLNSWFEGQNQK